MWKFPKLSHLNYTSNRVQFQSSWNRLEREMIDSHKSHTPKPQISGLGFSLGMLDANLAQIIAVFLNKKEYLKKNYWKWTK